MATALLSVLGTSLFTLVELWVLKLARLDVVRRLARANAGSDHTRFFLESLVLVAFILVQPALLLGLLALASPDLARGLAEGLQSLLSWGLALGR